MSERLTLQDLIDLLSDKQNITKKDAETFLRELVALISETIEDKDFVRIKDFGTFKLTPVKPRKSVNVSTGESIEIPGHYRLSFVPDKVLREGVNKPFSHFESILLQDEEVTFEEKAAKASAKFEEKKAARKAEEAQAEEKKAIVKPAPVKVEPKLVVEEPELDDFDFEEEEEPIEDNKVEEVLKNTPSKEALTKKRVTADDLKREKELADLSSFIAKNVDEENAVAQETVLVSQQPKPVVESEPIASKRSAARQQEEEDDDYDYSNYERELAEQRRKRNTWMGVGVAILLVLGVGIWGYNNFSEEPEVIPHAQNNAGLRVSDDNTAQAVEPKTTLDEDAEELLPIEEEPVKEVVPPTQPAQGAREIVVKSGQTMRALGQEYYGHRSFWVYIFEENRAKIKKPDDVFAGMKLTLPATDKYDIDATDKASIAKAERLELKYFGEFSQK